MRPLSNEQKSLLAGAVSLFEQHRSVADAYLQGRGISPATSERFRLGVVPNGARGFEDFAGRLAIPAIGPAGNVYSIRFRCLLPHDCGEVGCPKYLGMDGIETRLFNVRAVAQAVDYIALLEGEIDAISCEVARIPAVGVPGVNNWKRHHRRLFEGFRVLVVGDNDEAGKRFRKAVTADLMSAVGVTLDPSVNDVNELLVREGEAGVRKAFGLE